jgi:hypothetical protein
MVYEARLTGRGVEEERREVAEDLRCKAQFPQQEN